MPPRPERIAPTLVELYDTYRSSLLNKLYYGRMLARYRVINTIFETLIAIGATGSGISGAALWQVEPYGQLVWTSIATSAATLAVAKPILQIGSKVERYTKLYTGHLFNSLSLWALISKVKREQELTDDIIQKLEQAQERHVEISQDDDPYPNKRVHKICEAAVRLQVPDKALWWPAQ
jgi:hypothetical protein